MSISYLMYQAERPRGAAEQRESDAATGELAASFAQLGRTLRRVAGRKEQAAPCAASATAACTIPRPRSAASR